MSFISALFCPRPHASISLRWNISPCLCSQNGRVVGISPPKYWNHCIPISSLTAAEKLRSATACAVVAVVLICPNKLPSSLLSPIIVALNALTASRSGARAAMLAVSCSKKGCVTRSLKPLPKKLLIAFCLLIWTNRRCASVGSKPASNFCAISVRLFIFAAR